MSKFAKPVEPAEPAPAPGWLRSRFMHARYPRPGVAPCGRQNCPVRGEAPVECAAVDAEEKTTR